MAASISKRLGPMVVAAALLAAGCARERVDLAPATGATAIAGGEGAVEERAGVRMRVIAENWTGPADISLEVTPLRLEIINQGSQPLVVRYDGFALIAPDGARYNALPPLGIEGAVAHEVEAAPILEPTFDSDGFAVAPYYNAYYPGFGVAADPYYYDPLYYDTYYDYWVDLQLPTARMLQVALPDGRLEPGGRVVGWLYFERVDPGLGRVRFRADLVGAADGRKFGELTIPFVVRGD